MRFVNTRSVPSTLLEFVQAGAPRIGSLKRTACNTIAMRFQPIRPKAVLNAVLGSVVAKTKFSPVFYRRICTPGAH
jgi:hypothetical protein